MTYSQACVIMCSLGARQALKRCLGGDRPKLPRPYPTHSDKCRPAQGLPSRGNDENVGGGRLAERREVGGLPMGSKPPNRLTGSLENGSPIPVLSNGSRVA